MPEEDFKEELEESGGEEILPSDEPLRWCTNCNEYVNVKGKRKNMCVNCGLFTAKEAPTDVKKKEHPRLDAKKEAKEREELKKEKDKIDTKLLSRKSIDFSGKDIATMEMLINAGVGEDPSDLAKKGIDLLYRSVHMPFNQQQLNLNQEQMQTKESKEETFEDIDKMKEKDIVRRYKELQIKRMERELNGGNSGQKPSEDKLIEQMEKQMKIKSMKETLKDNKEDGMGVDQLFKWKMMDKMFGNSEKSSESQAVQALQTQVNSLHQQLQQEKASAQQQMQNERMMQKIEQMGNQKGMTAQDVLTFSADKQSVIKAAESEIQKQRDFTHKAEQEALRTEQDLKLKELKIEMEKVKSGKKSDLKDFVEKFEEVKRISAVIGEREKGTGEMVMESIGNIAEKAGPALTEFLKAKQQPPMPQQLPQEFPQEFPQELPPEQPNFESINPSSELTASEKQMSKTMGDIYLKNPKK